MARTHLERRYALLEKLAKLSPQMREAQVKDSPFKAELEAKVDEVNAALLSNRAMCAGELPGQAKLFS